MFKRSDNFLYHQIIHNIHLYAPIAYIFFAFSTIFLVYLQFPLLLQQPRFCCYDKEIFLREVSKMSWTCDFSSLSEEHRVETPCRLKIFSIKCSIFEIFSLLRVFPCFSVWTKNIFRFASDPWKHAIFVHVLKKISFVWVFYFYS